MAELLSFMSGVSSLLCCLLPVAKPHASVGERRRVHMPPTIHTTLTDPKERVIIVGDVHGCLDELNSLLGACNYSSERDTVILVGDLVSSRVDMYAASSAGYAEELSAEDAQYLRGLPFTISLPTLGALVVHAGLVPGVALEAQDPAGMYTMRNVVKRHSLSPYAWTDKPTHGTPWAGEWRGQPHVYFGHDAKRGLQQCAHATGLDTGCCYGRSLSAMVLPERRLVQVPAQRVYSEPGG